MVVDGEPEQCKRRLHSSQETRIGWGTVRFFRVPALSYSWSQDITVTGSAQERGKVTVRAICQCKVRVTGDSEATACP